MIRIAIVLLVASAYFSPAHSAAVDQPGAHDNSARVRLETERTMETVSAIAWQQPVATRSNAPMPEPSVVSVPLPHSLWLFVSALAAGLLLIRRRRDQT